MKGLILGAGFGKRLLPYTQEIPKCLLPVGEKTFLEYTLDNFAAAGFSEVVIVVGHGKEKVIDKIGTRYLGMKITYRFNDTYLTTNTMRSIWNARDALSGGFVQCHGDLLFHKGVLKKVLASPVKDAVIVEGNQAHLDEDGNRVRLENGRVVEINKTMPLKNAAGHAWGMYKFSPESAASYFKHMAAFDLNGNEGFELPFRKALEEHSFGIIDVEGLPFAEIDTLDDLARARTVASSIIS